MYNFYINVRVVSIVFLSIFFLACEAPLNLGSIEEQASQSILRFDQFQAAAKNDQAIIVVGSAGVILSSYDNAETWSRTILTGYPSLIDVSVCPDGSFAILDFNHAIWTNSDDTWLEEKIIPSTETPQAITCDAENKIWVTASFSTIFSSTDKGESWNTQSMDEDLMLTSIQFIDTKTAYAIGEFGTVLKSKDNAETWEFIESLPGEFYPQATYFSDAENGWVVGLRGKILHTNDGGKNWQFQTTTVETPLYGINGSNSKIYAVGDTGKLLEYDNNSNWKEYLHDIPIRFYLRAILPLENGFILMAGGAGALHKLKVK